ncbi:DUF6777 domain-containing protein [Streptomyces sp. NPDC086787]|uniref:DUF6777 domain-containing protein n=1 Tax=Streptomyces sp. NPDC086787 TaxID=3365759 RepID=UPI00380DE7AF
MPENTVRLPSGTTGAACVLATALLAAGCARGGAEATGAGKGVVLQPLAERGPDPFTDSTVTSPANAAAATPLARPSAPVRQASVPRTGMRTLSGGTPGLYGGTAWVGSCDVERQIRYLAADPARGLAFAGAEGVARKAVPEFLRGLTPVVLRADTGVTNHGFRDGRATAFQSVLQAGTAVLVDDRGVPRVRCACGNPLKPPQTSHGVPGTAGQPWSGYRPTDVIEVRPAPQAITSISLVDTTSHSWIERRIGHDVRHDHVVSPPARQPQTPQAQQPRPQTPHTQTPRPTVAPTTPTPGTATGTPDPWSQSPTGQPTPDLSWAPDQQWPSGQESVPAEELPPGQEPEPAEDLPPAEEPTPASPAEEPTPAQEPTPAEDLPPAQDPPPDDPAVTDPAVTDPAVTDPTVTDPALTDLAVTDPGLLPRPTDGTVPETAPETDTTLDTPVDADVLGG